MARLKLEMHTDGEASVTKMSIANYQILLLDTLKSEG